MPHQSQTYQSVTRVLGGALALLLAALGLQVALPQLTPPASASSYTMLCSGFTQCNAKGMSAAGYHQHWGHMYWNMYSGRNCVNYVAYRMVAAGMPDKRPWSGSGNATNWGRAMSSITDKTPAVGSVAWWAGGAPGAGSLGHVAYVEKVVSSSEIVISESNWGSDFSWRRITKAGYWPTGFIHFRDRQLVNKVRPQIVGSAKVGVRLAVGGGTWSPVGKPHYQWLQDGKPIAGKTGRTFMPIRTQIGHRLSVRVTATRPNYTSASVVTAATAPVVPGDLTVTRQPSISGTAEVGKTLTVDPGSYSPSGASTAVQWYADGAPIKGATGTTFVPTQAYAGKVLSATVRATRMGHNPLAVSAGQTAAVIGTPVRVARAGNVTGLLRPGKVLTAHAGQLRPSSAQVASYTWRRNGVPIPGAHGATYRLTTADAGKRITVVLHLTAPDHKAVNVKYTRGVAKVFPRIRITPTPGERSIRVTVHVSAPGVSFDGRLIKVMSYSRVRWARIEDGVARVTYTGIPAGRRRVEVTFANPMVTTRTVQVATRVRR